MMNFVRKINRHGPVSIRQSEQIETVAMISNAKANS